jgi:amino acid adenylation domain-containing protein
LLEGLEALSRRRGVTLFMTLLSAYAALLRRYTGQDDIAVGIPIAHRTRRETENVIGYFANTLVIRNDLAGDPSFESLLERTRATALEAYAHQDTPFEQLVEALNPVRSLAHSPLFQVMFVLQNAPLQPEEVDGLSVSRLVLPEEEGIARFDMHLAMGEVEGQLSGRIEYNSDIFDRARIERFVSHFQNLLTAIVETPGASIGSYEYLTAEEQHHQRVTLNDTSRDFPADATLCDLFEAQVERTPDSIVLDFKGETLTYRQLNERANALAHYLLDLGVRPDEPVGLCTERSLEMVIGIYGILKAGGAYMPLDPEYPPERLGLMVANARVRYVIAHGRTTNLLPDGAAQVIDVSSPEGRATLSRYGIRNSVRNDLHSRHLAYVIHTSGSTGQPKGVMNEHRGVVNRILWMQNEYRLTPADVVLQKTPFSFDVSVWEFIWPLLCGARLVIAEPGSHRDPDALVSLIREKGVTVLHFVPSMLDGMLLHGQWGRCHSVRLVFCSGEALSRETVKAFFASGTRSELHNLYGPTEAAIDVTYWPCTNAAASASVPIGKAIQNIQLYIVDENLKLVPQGATGELLIGGVGVARGYIHRPDLTQERFIPDPFSADVTARLYRTGDLVRRQPGGDIEYIGRMDGQVKINGLRIELGEIEAHLDRLDFVRKSVVIAHRGTGRSPRLVAYLLPQERDAEIPVARIREALAARLPAFMVPQIYVALDSIPLSANGKLDRRRLPEPPEEMRTRAECVTPVTETEHRLTEIWTRNLGVSAMGVTDDYFALGGDSIRAIALVAQARAAGLEFAMRDLFVHPTIRALAEAFDAGRLAQVQNDVPEAFDLITDDEKRALLNQFS